MFYEVFLAERVVIKLRHLFKLRLGASRTRSVGWLVGRSFGLSVGRSVCLIRVLGY